tara:strand:- start:246 stop:1076 length:831 start_codon:yes stop_codon:yes gene_type:complete
MENNEGVIEESPTLESTGPEDYEGRMVDALVEARVETDGESSAPVTPNEAGETEPDSDESSEASTDPSKEKVEAKTEGSKEEQIPKSSFLKRVNGLQAAKRKLEERSLDQERELAEYREAFQILQGRAYQAEKKLSEYEEVDPRDLQIQQMQQQQQTEEIRRKLEAEHQQRVEETQKEAFIEQRADEIIESAHNLAEKYPTLTAEEIVYKFRTSKLPMEKMAKGMHAKRYAYLKDNMAKDRTKPVSPRPVKAQGGMAPMNGTSEDDMMEYLSAKRS